MVRIYYKLFILLLLMTSCKDAKIVKLEPQYTISSVGESYSNKTLQVYTTAKDTELRLAKTNELTFKEKSQPLETGIAVFVNPKKTFQEYLGIGAPANKMNSFNRILEKMD
jgi:glucosylceramidase